MSRPNSFIFTLFGDLAHRDAGDPSLWIGSLVRVMAPFGISEAAVRQAVSRMSRQGWLAARRRGNRAFYAVTERGRRRIAELTPRIYGPIIDWDGRWRLLTYSVGENVRGGRDRLRKELSLLGWAPLAAATWISPADSLDAVREALGSNPSTVAVHAFAGFYCGPLSDRELVARCWDLAAIAAAYGAFLDRYEPRFAAERRAGLDDREAFVERLWLLHDYRKLAYADPGLPSELVPAHWPGTRAAALFRSYYAALDRKAHRYFVAQTPG
ncbi:MAG TPA: PaaX family transcriptional regulator C-terminal domain-containing protein [Candidatus Tumulicola sp.]